mmetsp:Transcript_102113/g.124927  ORF Transcript_102113/g.124927 Transcript_102113/m.124927 type:complete len:185 (-) Transcript_102113:43-597(-)
MIFVFVAGFGTNVYRSMFTLISKDTFQFSSSNIGFFIAYASIIATLTNTFLVGPTKEYLSDSKIIEYSVLMNGICLGIFGIFCYYNITNIYLLCLLTIPQSISSAFMYIMINGTMSKIVNKTEIGKSIALSHAIRSLISVVSPTVGGLLASNMGYHSIGIFGLISCLLSLSIYSSNIKPLGIIK